MQSRDKVRLRSQDFLARTGDRTSIEQLLEAVGSSDQMYLTMPWKRSFIIPGRMQN